MTAKLKIPTSVIREDTIVYNDLITRGLYKTAECLASEGHIDVDIYIPRYMMSTFEHSISELFMNYGKNANTFRALVRLTGCVYSDIGMTTPRLNRVIAYKLMYVNSTDSIDAIRNALGELERHEATASIAIRMSATQSSSIRSDMLMHQDNIHHLGESYVNLLRRHIVNDESPIYSSLVGCSPMEDEMTI